MKKKYSVEVKANNEAQANDIAELVQWVLDNIEPNDIQKLLTKVEKKPSIVKTALTFA